MSQTSPTVPKIMIIEDDFALSDAFSMVFSHSGFEVQVAYNGQDALDKLSSFTPDIIILDILMPVMDGRKFLANFKNPNRIPVIALSNLDARSEIEQVMKLGANRYLLKSNASPQMLIDIVKETLG